MWQHETFLQTLAISRSTPSCCESEHCVENCFICILIQLHSPFTISSFPQSALTVPGISLEIQIQYTVYIGVGHTSTYVVQVAHLKGKVLQSYERA